MLEVQGDIKCELGDRIQLGNEKFSKPDDEGSKSSDNNLSFDLNIESDECIEEKYKFDLREEGKMKTDHGDDNLKIEHFKEEDKKSSESDVNAVYEQEIQNNEFMKSGFQHNIEMSEKENIRNL